MRLGILSRGIALTEAIRNYATRRIRTALGRYQQALISAQVRLIDVNGPRGGIDKHCVVEVRGPALAPIVVRERGADLYAAIDRVADRLDRAVARRIGRTRVINRCTRGLEPEAPFA